MVISISFCEWKGWMSYYKILTKIGKTFMAFDVVSIFATCHVLALFIHEQSDGGQMNSLIANDIQKVYN